MKTPTPTDKNAIDHATSTIRQIEFLNDCNEFKSFMAGFKNRADQMADMILHDNAMSPDEREAMRRERLGILEVLQAPSTLHNGASSVLRSHGIG